MRQVRGLILLAGCALLSGATHVIAGDALPTVPTGSGLLPVRSFAQVVALDECDPTTFNAALGESGTGFCHNVALSALGFATTLNDLFAKAAAGTPDPGWDFEPDELTIDQDTLLSVVDQGGEPHTFTEVAKFGGGFIADLNHDEPTVPECAGGFSNLAVARTRIVQGSHRDVTGLAPGKHRFQCCIHPWMRMEVDVK